MRKLKARLPCSACGKLGHWKDDPECPKKHSGSGSHRHGHKKHKKKKKKPKRRSRENVGYMLSSAVPSASSTSARGGDNAALGCTGIERSSHFLKDSVLSAHDKVEATNTGSQRMVAKWIRQQVAFQVLFSKNPDVMMYFMLLDTACAKSVAGEPWVKVLIDRMKELGVPIRTVEESEPFRFGPGKCIKSSWALLIPIIWGESTFVLRVSVVDKDIPCLMSRPAMKRLCCQIDLGHSTVTVAGLGGAEVKLMDMPTGHVAAPIFGSDFQLHAAKTPQPTESAFDMCEKGAEVAVCDLELEKKLEPVVFSVCVHAVGLDMADTSDSNRSEGSLGSDRGESLKQLMAKGESDCTSGSDGSDRDNGIHVTYDSMEDVRLLQRKSRMRAAPFFKECTPGWRARARGLVSPRTRLARGVDIDSDSLYDVPGAYFERQSGERDCVPSMAPCSTPCAVGRCAKRSGSTTCCGRPSLQLNLAYEQGRARRGRPPRVGDELRGSKSEDGATSARADSPSSLGSRGGTESSVSGTSGLGSDEEGGPASRVPEPRHPRRRHLDAPEDDSGDTRRCRRKGASHFTIDSGSDADDGGSWSEAEEQFFPSSFPCGNSAGLG